MANANANGVIGIEVSSIGANGNDTDDELSFDGIEGVQELRTGSDNRSSGSGTGNGTDNGSSDDSGGTSTGTRRPRGRPKGSKNAVQNILVQPLADGAKKRGRPSKKTGTQASEIATVIATICNGIATFRGDHWQQSVESVLPFATPVSDALDRLPAKTAKKIGDMMLPVGLIIGAVQVFGPTVKIELDYHNYVKAQRKNANGNQRSKQSDNGNARDSVPGQFDSQTGTVATSVTPSHIPTDDEWKLTAGED